MSEDQVGPIVAPAEGSPTGRTILMSPLMVAAAAVTGSVADAREVFQVNSAN